MPRTFMQISAEKTALFLFGIFFITVLLIVAIAIPNPTDANWRIFNLVLALVAAATGAVLPGARHLQFSPWLKADNALDAYLLSYDDFKIRQQSCGLTRSWVPVISTLGVARRQRESI